MTRRVTVTSQGKGLAGNLSGLVGTAVKVGAVAGAFVANKIVQGITDLVTNTAQAADFIDKLSERTGREPAAADSKEDATRKPPARFL